jgi:hypothetical protein
MNQPPRAYSPPVLSIRLLGGFRLSYREQVLRTFNTARLQALLAYLLLQRDAPVSRQHLAFLFWPDSSEPLPACQRLNPTPKHFWRSEKSAAGWKGSRWPLNSPLRA